MIYQQNFGLKLLHLEASNVTPRKNKDKTPYELFFGIKLNVSYLRIFGCIVYYHIPKEKRNKLELPGKIGIMVGYSREKRGIYDPENEIVLEERSVKFNELKFNELEQTY